MQANIWQLPGQTCHDGGQSYHQQAAHIAQSRPVSALRKPREMVRGHLLSQHLVTSQKPTHKGGIRIVLVTGARQPRVDFVSIDRQNTA